MLPVVILHWNRPERCVGTVERFLDQDVPGGVLVVVVDNGSEPEALAIVRKGSQWSRPFQVEDDPRPAFDGPTRREYSYPFLIATRDGRYHVVYTWQRTKIKHVVFNAAWVRAALP